MNTAAKKTIRDIDPEDFVRAYQRSQSTSEVAARLGITAHEVRIRASAMRSKGIPLKRMQQGMNKWDVPALRRLAEDELLREQSDKAAGVPELPFGELELELQRQGEARDMMGEAIHALRSTEPR